MSDLPLLDQKYQLTEDQLVRFREDGFLRASNVFDAATLRYFEPEISRLTFAHNHLDGTPMKERDTYSKAFIQRHLLFNVLRQMDYTIILSVRIYIGWPGA